MPSDNSKNKSPSQSKKSGRKSPHKGSQTQAQKGPAHAESSKGPSKSETPKDTPQAESSKNASQSQVSTASQKMSQAKEPQKSSQSQLTQPTHKPPKFFPWKLVGEQNPNPDTWQRPEPLDREKVMRMDQKTRVQMIVRRANYFLYLAGPMYTDSQSFRGHCEWAATEDGSEMLIPNSKEYTRFLLWFTNELWMGTAGNKYDPAEYLRYLVTNTDIAENTKLPTWIIKCSHKKPEKPLFFDVQEMEKIFPYSPGESSKNRLQLIETSEKLLNIDSLKTRFVELIAVFKTTDICGRLIGTVKAALGELSKQKIKIDKIVAFGLMCLSTGSLDGPLSRTLMFQHASLLVMRETIQDFYRNPKRPAEHKVEIYLQDPQYTKLDEEVLKMYDMHICSCDLGHQLALTKLDTSTLVVDYNTRGFPVVGISLEITKPAAFFLCFQDDPKSLKSDPTPINEYSYTAIKNGRQVTWPGWGDYISNAFQQLVTEYDYRPLHLENLDVGTRQAHDGKNGNRGISYLGLQPSMYFRRPGAK